MANEKNEKKTEMVNEAAPVDSKEKADATELNADAAEADISSEIITELKVERENFEYGDDARTCYDYFIRGIFQKKDGPKEIKIHLAPRDVGGYEVLDLLYDMYEDGVQFRLNPWSIPAEKKGEKDTTGITYIIASPVAPEKLRLKVKPAKDSDKAALGMLLFFMGYNV